MSSIKYLLQSKSENSSIYLRLSISRKVSIKRKIGLSINYNNWSVKTGMPKQNDSTNKNLTIKLRNLQTFVLDELNKANSVGDLVDGSWLTNKIDLYFNRVVANDKKLDYLIEYCEHFLKELKYRVNQKGEKGVSVSTHKKYRTIANKLKAFEKYSKKKFLVENVDLNFRTDLINYFSEVDRLGDNTIGRYLKVVKGICTDAQRNGIKTSSQLKHFKGFTVKAPKIVLSFEELSQINDTKFTNINHEIAKDWLIIGCFTGQRVSDLLRMNISFIQKVKGVEFIVLEQKKTKKIVQIPIHFEVEKILKKRNGNFPPIFSKNIDSNKVFFNRYLKQLCKIAKITEIVEGNFYDKNSKRTVRGEYEKHNLISSHICRRSFATNFYAKRNYPTPLLMNITGHSTEKMFLEYIGKKPIDYSMQLAEIWINEIKKGSCETQLTVVKDAS